MYNVCVIKGSKVLQLIVSLLKFNMTLLKSHLFLQQTVRFKMEIILFCVAIM